MRSAPKDRDRWFNVDPAWMIFTHFPADEFWQQLDKPIPQEHFEKLPYFLPDSSKKAIQVLLEEISK